MLFPGAIELAILSDYYGREIAAYDIQTKRCDVYGQVKRCIVINMVVWTFFYMLLKSLLSLICYYLWLVQLASLTQANAIS